MTDKERLQAIINFSGLSTRAFAKHIDIKSPQTLYDILNEKHGISKDLAERISVSYLNIDRAWLLTGEGEMLKNETSDSDRSSIEELSASNLDVLVRVLDKISDSEQRNSKNIEELIAQGREQTGNITKLVNLLCKSGVDTNNPVDDREKRALKTSGSSEQNTATDAENANAV